jgi:glycosyltransferase involved in cell wall biosynthesis
VRTLWRKIVSPGTAAQKPGTLLTLLSFGNFFANAGQAVVERTLLQYVSRTGRYRIRVLGEGDDHSRRRFEEFCRAETLPGSIEILSPPFPRRDVLLAGATAALLHSFPGTHLTRELVQNGIWLAVPTLQMVHSFAGTHSDRLTWSYFWGYWKGWPPCHLVSPSKATAQRLWSSCEALLFGGQLPPLSVIPWGVEAETFRAGNREAARARLGCAPDALVLLCLGRLSPEKLHFPQLVRAFARLKEKLAPSRNLHLVLAGGHADCDHDYLQDLHSLLHELGLSSSATVLTHFPDHEKLDLLAAADLVLTPAAHPQESFGLVLLEAMAAGVPVLATDWNGYPEVLPPSYHPHLLPTIADHRTAMSESYGRLGEACAIEFRHLLHGMEKLLLDQELRKTLIADGLRQASRLTWQNTASRILDVVDSMQRQFQRGKALASEHRSSPAIISPVDGLASNYLSGATRVRHVESARAFPAAENSVWSEALLSVCREKQRFCLNDLNGCFSGDRVMRNRFVLEMLRSGWLETI